MPEKIYVPAPGKRIPLPGNRADWPKEGRPLNPLSVYERRLVKDGDLVEAPEKPAKAKEPSGETGGDK
jgi:hypothetical protein